MTLTEIRDDFAFLDDWEDRYRYVIELGRSLPPLAPELRIESNKVRAAPAKSGSRPRSSATGTRRASPSGATATPTSCAG